MPMDAARSILTEVWGSRGYPVDPVWIACQLGLKVIEGKLPDDVSGALIKKMGHDPVILIESRDSKNRRRVTCAHEIGHYVNRTKDNDGEYDFVDLRNADSENSTRADEIYANQFAANLLMPEAEVRAFHKEGLPSIALAYRFGVSDETMRSRLRHLGLRF